ncbi:helix-turn-helix domain-containing protein [Mycolicibacterium mageritense]|uniref:helix-turn-helix domain-containing protein n=1 Tax=Mycolicibacterium mageritense TaxID=53462 RepID=UPI0011D94942|nr:helix-turn-helix domain-containing protein [Mycolicibacterium mageritense]TXI62498.1 MAG: DNA-binding protein [Mycolicibacterium mageritense]
MTKPAPDPLTDAVTALTAALRDVQLTPPRILTADSLLTTSEAAAELRICRSYFYKLMASDQIRTLKLGSRTLVRYSEVVRFINELDADQDD